jgi:integrase
MPDTHIQRGDEVKRLKAEMADAHPDRGGTSNGFAVARQRYLDARASGRVRQSARGAGFRNAKDLAKLANGMHADRQCRGLYVQVRRDPTNGSNSMSWLYRWKPRGQGDDSDAVEGRIADALESGEYEVSGEDRAIMIAALRKAAVRKGAKSSRVMGLGPCDCTAANLEGARKRSAEARELVAAGKDPVEERERLREDQAKKLRHIPTFKEYATVYVKRKETEWKNPVHRKQWCDTLGIGGFGKSNMRYCESLHGLRVNKIDRHAIYDVLDPIWPKKPETASRLRGRLERILDAAKAEGLREGDNPAAWKGNLETRYSPKSKLREVKHHAALPWQKIPGFLAELRRRGGIAEACIELLVLTATRSREARGARWEEIDFEAKCWTIPASRMKKKKAHAIPLSEAAIAVLKRMEAIKIRSEDEARDLRRFVFPGLVWRKRANDEPRDSGISDTSLRNVLRDLGITKDKASIHGMRSSFRDWAGEKTNFAREVCEHALAHGIPDATEKAYFRSELYEKRVELMAAWGAFCG